MQIHYFCPGFFFALDYLLIYISCPRSFLSLYRFIWTNYLYVIQFVPKGLEMCQYSFLPLESFPTRTPSAFIQLLLCFDVVLVVCPVSHFTSIPAIATIIAVAESSNHQHFIQSLTRNEKDLFKTRNKTGHTMLAEVNKGSSILWWAFTLDKSTV